QANRRTLRRTDMEIAGRQRGNRESLSKARCTATERDSLATRYRDGTQRKWKTGKRRDDSARTHRRWRGGCFNGVRCIKEWDGKRTALLSRLLFLRDQQVSPPVHRLYS